MIVTPIPEAPNKLEDNNQLKKEEKKSEEPTLKEE